MLSDITEGQHQVTGVGTIACKSNEIASEERQL